MRILRLFVRATTPPGASTSPAPARRTAPPWRGEALLVLRPAPHPATADDSSPGLTVALGSG
jgi:hypothetical protein